MTAFKPMYIGYLSHDRLSFMEKGEYFMLGKYVRVKVTAPMHSINRRFGYEYKLNFGIVEGYGREKTSVQGAYIMGINRPVRNFDGRVIAIIRRHGGRGVVWVVAPKSTRFIINDIKPAIAFAERNNSYDLECLYERSCGAVVFSGSESDRKVLLIRNRRSAHWGFPKGHIEPGETQEETAIRETKEETGLDISLIDGFSCKSEYTIQGKVEKAVVIFLGRSENQKVTMQEEEIEEYIWTDFRNAMSMLKFENDKNILRKAMSFITANNIA